MRSREDIIQSARSQFKDHRAEFTRLDPDTAVLRWAKPGSGRNAIEFILRRNTLCITGDLGYAVLNLTEKADVARLSKYSPDYFLSKIEAATDGYVYDRDVIQEELLQELGKKTALLLPDRDDFKSESDYDKAMEEAGSESEQLEELYECLIGHSTEEEGILNAGARAYLELLEQKDPDCAERFAGIGKHPAERVFFWLMALQMAASKLNERSTQ